MTPLTDNALFSKITNRTIEVQRLRSVILQLIHEFYSAEGFILVDPPILHEQIPQKKREFYLPQLNNKFSLNSSNALYLGAYASIFGKVYSISPTFRLEDDSLNHLKEFRMIEAEMVGVDYVELMDFVERFIRQVLLGLCSKSIIQDNT